VAGLVFFCPCGDRSFLALGEEDDGLAQEAAELAARHRLRSSDAVYAAVARRFGATLITLDAEQGERAAAVVPVRRPEETLD